MAERPLRATYRLQLRPGFGFDEAAAIAPYLAELGVSHLYLSPVLQAGHDSTHGYDVVDHGALSKELGGQPGFERLAAAAHAAGLGLVLDIVPNHMSIAHARNRWWWDVLENGPSARSARVFDVDWDPPEAKLKNVVLVPILGDHRGTELANGTLKVAREDDRFLVRYHDHRLPIAPRSVGFLLGEAQRRAPDDRLGFLADAYAELPSPTALDLESVERRHRDKAVLGEILRQHLAETPRSAAAIDEVIATLNADPDALDSFLDRQNFRLAYWRSAQRDLDYRRFFDITTLVGLRVEDPGVFQATHALYADLAQRGLLDGVRVDHVDGLSDPAAYLRALRGLVGPARIWVEKILAVDEELPAWPIAGTTGYEYLNALTRASTSADGLAGLAALAAELTGEARSFAELAIDARLLVLREGLAADVLRLSNLAAGICERHRDARDFTRHDLHAALRAIVACFPVYRSYLTPGHPASPADEAVIERALAGAPALAPDVEPGVFAFLREVLLLRRTGDAEAELVRRFQQLTPPALAKGVEDTAFYRDPVLLALDEVGGDPAHGAASVDALHAANARAAELWPERLLATSTHDTKRSEDVRARLVLLPDDREAFSVVARGFFAQAKQHLDGGAPDPLVRMVTLQTLIGAWPIDAERLSAFLLKSTREAKLATSWTRPDERYEAALGRFAAGILGDAAITGPIAAYVARLAPAGRAVSLAWTLLKLTSPGVPDLYQGAELWRFDLVDPDNRRPVDWEAARAALAAASSPPAIADDGRGLTKLALVRTTLAHRRAHAARFARGARYEPLRIEGPGAQHVAAYARSAPGAGASVVVAVLRPLALAPLRAETRVVLPAGRFEGLLCPGHPEGPTPLDALCGPGPVALLSEVR